MNQIIKPCCMLVMLVLSGVTVASENPASPRLDESSLHVLWDKRPISFSVPVGQERMITFPSRVVFKGSDAPSLGSDKVDVVNNDGTLYIRSKKEFSSVRVPVVINKTGDVVLVDISSKQNSDDTPVEVLIKKHEIKNKAESTTKGSNSASYIALLRYAVQHLYAPKRLVKEDVNIYRTAMYTTKSIAIATTSNVMAMPLVSWRSNNYYVTAVLLKNVWGSSVTLDPREFTGQWLAAGFYPRNHLSPKGRDGDRTTAFLVSSVPFSDALGLNKEYVQ